MVEAVGEVGEEEGEDVGGGEGGDAVELGGDWVVVVSFHNCGEEVC